MVKDWVTPKKRVIGALSLNSKLSWNFLEPPRVLPFYLMGKVLRSSVKPTDEFHIFLWQERSVLYFQTFTMMTNVTK